MLLTSLTPNELERLAYLEPGRLDVARAYSVVCHRELRDARDEFEELEQEAAYLADRVNELEAELYS